jgi:hypothetical protein
VEGFASMSIDRGVTERFTVEAPNVVTAPDRGHTDGHTSAVHEVRRELADGRSRALTPGADHRVLPAGDMPINEALSTVSRRVMA